MKTRTHIFVKINFLLFISCFVAIKAEAQKPEDLLLKANIKLYALLSTIIKILK